MIRSQKSVLVPAVFPTSQLCVTVSSFLSFSASQFSPLKLDLPMAHAIVHWPDENITGNENKLPFVEAGGMHMTMKTDVLRTTRKTD